jgi:hypothetical protein
VRIWKCNCPAPLRVTGEPQSRAERVELTRRMLPTLSRAGTAEDRLKRLHGLTLLLPALSLPAVRKLQPEGAGGVAHAA